MNFFIPSSAKRELTIVCNFLDTQQQTSNEKEAISLIVDETVF